MSARFKERRVRALPGYAGPFRRSTDTRRHPERSGASRSSEGPTRHSRLQAWLQLHQLAFAGALERILKNRLAAFMTVAVIGIALALPAALQVAIKNAAQINQGLGDQAQISLFLKKTVAENQGMSFAQTLEKRVEIESVEYMPAEDALREFQQASGFGQALEHLKDNPIPALVIVHPSAEHAQGEALGKLLDSLKVLPEVDTAQVDREWLERLYALLDLLRQSTLLITIFLVLAVVMVVGNTIRLMSQSYRDEIQVFKLVGATDAFVRRPFLYSGMLYGAAGAVLALCVVWGGLLWLTPAVERLTGLYQASIGITGLGLADMFSLLLIGVILGLGGSWIAVNRFIEEVDV